MGGGVGEGGKGWVLISCLLPYWVMLILDLLQVETCLVILVLCLECFPFDRQSD